jgi:hypothetical protein
MSDLSVTLPMQLMGRILHGYDNCKRSMETSLLLRGDVHTSDLFVTRRMQLMGRILPEYHNCKTWKWDENGRLEGKWWWLAELSGSLKSSVQDCPVSIVLLEFLHPAEVAALHLGSKTTSKRRLTTCRIKTPLLTNPDLAAIMFSDPPLLNDKRSTYARHLSLPVTTPPLL